MPGVACAPDPRSLSGLRVGQFFYFTIIFLELVLPLFLFSMADQSLIFGNTVV